MIIILKGVDVDTIYNLFCKFLIASSALYKTGIDICVAAVIPYKLPGKFLCELLLQLSLLFYILGFSKLCFVVVSKAVRVIPIRLKTLLYSGKSLLQSIKSLF